MSRSSHIMAGERAIGAHIAGIRKTVMGTGAGGKFFEAECSCGWHGPGRDRDGRETAVADRDDHLAGVSR